MGRLGYCCSYTPLPLLRATGFTPHRVLPDGQAPDQAGTMLHDNMCPEVKGILDRKLAGDLPRLDGMVFVNSCDAMRRLYNAWVELDAPDRVFLLDLPTSPDDRAVAYLAGQLDRLRQGLAAIGEAEPTDAAIGDAIDTYDRLYALAVRAGARVAEGRWSRATLQRWLNRLVSESPEEMVTALEHALAETTAPVAEASGVPLLLFGNVLPDPEAAEMLESCGARVVADDLCTGSRQLTWVGGDDSTPVMHRLARAILHRPLCARTVIPGDGHALASQALQTARDAHVRGAVAHVLKFCDPYLLRMPDIRETFQREGMPLLVLEGDCTLRSLGQQRTRIEAFVEMLEEA